MELFTAFEDSFSQTCRQTDVKRVVVENLSIYRVGPKTEYLS